MKYSIQIFVLLYFLMVPINTNAQLLKKLKNRAADLLEQVIATEETPETTIPKPEENEEIGNIPTPNNPRNKEKVTKETTTTTNNVANQIVIAAPNSSFDAIELMAHMGRPIFNALYLRDNTDTYPEYSKHSFERWEALIGLKYTQMYIKQMNKEQLIMQNANKTVDEYTNFNAQGFIQKMGGLLLTRDEWTNYYCLGAEDVYCDVTMRKSWYRNNSIWGGMNASAFYKQKIYRQFIKDHLETLVNWSQTQFSNDAMEGYVTWDKTGYYDFEKKGYWIEIPQLHDTKIFEKKYKGFGTLVTTYKPSTPFEDSLAQIYQQGKSKVFFPLSSEKANDVFKGKGVGIFTVTAKIMLKYLKTEEPLDGNFKLIYPEFEWNLVSPTMEIYAKDEWQDFSLKLGEIHCATSDYK